MAIATGEEDGLAERKGGSGGDADAGGVTAGHLIKSAAYRAAVVAYIAKCGEVGSSAARSPTASPLPDGGGAAGAGTQQHAGFAPVAPPSYPPPPPPEHRRPPLRTSGAAAAAGAGGEGAAAAAAAGEMATQPFPLLNAEALEHTDDDDADTDADADANLYTNGNVDLDTTITIDHPAAPSANPSASASPTPPPSPSPPSPSVSPIPFCSPKGSVGSTAAAGAAAAAAPATGAGRGRPKRHDAKFTWSTVASVLQFDMCSSSTAFIGLLVITAAVHRDLEEAIIETDKGELEKFQDGEALQNLQKIATKSLAFLTPMVSSYWWRVATKLFRGGQ